MTAQQLTAQMIDDTRLALDTAAVQGAALRGELGREAQDVVLAQLSVEYRAAKATGNTTEALRIRTLVFSLVPME